MFQAVVMSCWAVEYATAVLFGTPQHVFSASAFVACVMPTAPGVKEATFQLDCSRGHLDLSLERDPASGRLTKVRLRPVRLAPPDFD